MSLSLLWLLGLAALLLVAVIRVARPRASWEAFRAGALADVERIRRETRQSSEAICGAEALLPLRALVRELPLPAGVSVRESVREEGAGPAEMRLLVTSPRASLMLRLTCPTCRLPGSRRMAPAGVWRLAVRDVGSGSTGPDAAARNVGHDIAPDGGPDICPDIGPVASPDVWEGVWADIWQGVWPVEESFDDLAACAARLRNCVVDPASALESVHAASDG